MSEARTVRVLHLAKFYPPERGGMERVVQVLCESTEGPIRNEVLAAHTSRGTVREKVGHIAVTRASRWMQLGSVAVSPSFPLWLRRIRADVTVVHEPNALALVADWMAMSRGRLIVWFHADLVRPSWKYHLLYKPFLNRALRRASCIVVSSQPLADHAEGLAGVRDKCVVIPFGLDASRFDTPQLPPRSIRDFCDARRGVVALIVGRMVGYKGVDVFLDALAGTDISAVIVGTGPKLAFYRERATALGLQDRVLFAGEVTDQELIGCYQTCDFFVLASTSRQETFGVVQLEAMAAGKPIISTALPTGVPWVNQDGISGLVVPPGDSTALQSAMVRLARDEDLRLRLGRGASARVRTEFSLERVRERMVRLYQAVDAGRPTSLPSPGQADRPAQQFE